MKLTTYNAISGDFPDAPARGSFTVTPTDVAAAYFTEEGETAVARSLLVFASGTVHFLGADGVEDTWTLGASVSYPFLIPVAIKQVFATGTTVGAGSIKGLK